MTIICFFTSFIVNILFCFVFFYADGYAFFHSILYKFFLFRIKYPISKKHKPVKKLNEIADFLDYMLLNIESGKNVYHAFFAAAQHMQNQDLKKICTQITVRCQLGVSFRTALFQFKNKLKDSDDFRTVLDSLEVAMRYGAPVGSTLQYLSLQMRMSASTTLEELAAQAPIKMMFPVICFILPVIFIILSAGVVHKMVATVGGG